ncbi:MAG: hypothetical protein F4X97_05655 [Boseongicola sp. SB0662_bin_57]|nr:hypothetical protein [Boseongicola sp. SB0662_bin_57]
MQPRDLISSARKILGDGQVGSPKQSDLKRAMSTAYYAMFHAICRNCADTLVGKTPAFRSQGAWNQAYRAVDHRFAKSQCRSATMPAFPPEIADFAGQFASLQEKRHKADYDPSHRLTRHAVITEIDTADLAIKRLQNAAIKHKRAFAVWTVMKRRE